MDLLIRNLSMEYGKTAIFSNLNADLQSGNLIGLLGPNGAGKTTLIRILTTLLKPTHGKVMVDGKDIVSKPQVMRSILGYLPQQVPYFPNLTAREYLNYIADMKGMNIKETKYQVETLLEKLHLANTGSKYVKNFSGGMRQRVGIAAMLLNDPKIIIADEPSTGLDPEERAILRNILSELARNHLVLLSTHIVSDVEAIASQVLLIKEGNFLYQGTPENLVEKSTGYVWEYSIDKNAKSFEVPNQFEKPTISLTQKSDGVQIREISDKPQQLNAKQVSPTLEEAYLGVIKGVITL